MLLAAGKRPSNRAFAYALFMGGFSGCGGTDTTQAPPVVPDVPAASIALTGVPTTPIFVDDSVTLVVTLRSLTGAMLTGRRIDWSSNEPGIASVSATGQVRALREGGAVITAISSGQGATASFDIRVGRIVGEAGGAIRNGDSSFFLNMPRGIFAQPTSLIVSQLSDSLGDARVVPGTIFSVGTDSTPFLGFSSLKLRFVDSRVPAALTSESMQLHTRTAAGWVPTFRTTLDFPRRTVDGSIQRGGIYAVRSMPVSRIVVTGLNAAAGVYSGTRGSLSAEVYDSAGQRLPDRRVAWSSSAPTIVRVDSLGRVFGGDLGTATITATADGRSATTTVTSLISWASDFSEATEWNTYQGSMRHSAFVVASIDPARLREIWTVRPIPGASLSQATIGGGRVFLATQNGDIDQRVVALNPASGATIWTKTIPDVNTLNQPTYNNGLLYLTSNGINASYLFALRDADGAQVFRSPFDGFEGTSNAPLLIGNTVATPGGSDGGLYGFDATTGARRFFRQGSEADAWTPSEYQGRVLTTNGGLQSLNAIEGTLVSELPDSRLSLTTTAVANGPLLAGISNGQLFSINLATNTVLSVRSGFSGMPVLAGSNIFAFAGDRLEAVSLFGETTFTYALSPTCAAERRSIVHIRNLVFVSCASTDGVTGLTVAIDFFSRLPVWSYPAGGTLSLSASGVLYVVNADKVTAISAF